MTMDLKTLQEKQKTKAKNNKLYMKINVSGHYLGFVVWY